MAWKLYQKIIIWLCAFTFNLKGLFCIYIFLNLNQYHSQWLLPIGIFAILFSLGLYLLWTPCVVFLVLSAIATLILTVYIQVSPQLFSLYVSAFSLGSLLIILLIAPTLVKQLFNKKIHLPSNTSTH